MKHSMVGKKVVVTSEEVEPELRGEIGTVIGVMGWIYGQVVYKVKFDFDVSEFTTGGEPGKDIGLPACYIEEFEMDFDFLIDEALRTGDKAWFDELVAQKNNNSSLSSQLMF